MIEITPYIDENSSVSKYYQLYTFLKTEISSGKIVPHEKLPSLRNLSKHISVSISTVSQAYSQLSVEGYIYSKPNSGYYVSDIGHNILKNSPINAGSISEGHSANAYSAVAEIPDLDYDLSCFNFTRWKKCINTVLNDNPETLLFEGDPQGEISLRRAIADYIYSARNVSCNPEQIVIGAGTQQLNGQLSTILKRSAIQTVALESPGYIPVHNIFREHEFTIAQIPVLSDGMDIQRLPSNIPCAAYVNPSNQFPTGAIMPVGNRRRLLAWAEENGSCIIEDDYDSELRYFGKPLPSLKGLDNSECVIYLGSFSSTLFAAAKISFMVLPPTFQKIFFEIKDDYTQTCSKTEQLALSLFIKHGWYQKGIKKQRSLYSQKLSVINKTFDSYASGFIRTLSGSSGVNMLITVKSDKSPALLSKLAASLGISIVPAGYFTNTDEHNMIFNYNRLPLDGLENKMEDLIDLWINADYALVSEK